MKICINGRTYILSTLSGCPYCPFFPKECPGKGPIDCKDQFWHPCEPLSVFKLWK